MKDLENLITKIKEDMKEIMTDWNQRYYPNNLQNQIYVRRLYERIDSYFEGQYGITEKPKPKIIHLNEEKEI